MSKKSTKALASATLMSLVLTTALSAGPVKAAAGEVTRTSGADRYATAAQVAKSNWTTTDNVVLVSGEGYADSVSASALAKKLDAPILLTTPDTLSSDAEGAIEQLKPKNIYVIGGNASISQSIRNNLKTDYNLVELGGANRYETNAKVAEKLVELGVSASDVLVVGGEGFSDALSVAPVAAAKGQILLLANNNESSIQSVIDFVKDNSSKVTVVGTKNVINDTIYNALGASTRVDGGQDRFETNLNVLNEFKDSLKNDKLYVANASPATPDNLYADALVASALAGKYTAPLVLVDKDSSDATKNAVVYIGDTASKTTDLNVIGGEGVVSNSIVDAINKAVNPTPSDVDPEVSSISANGLTQIKVVFNQEVDEDTAEDVANYEVDGTKLTDEKATANLQDDNKTVLITLAEKQKQNDDVDVTVKKGILTDDKSDTVPEFSQTITFEDTTAPTLESVEVRGNNKLDIKFSEPVKAKGSTEAAALKSVISKLKINDKNLSSFSVNYDADDGELRYSSLDNAIKADDSDADEYYWTDEVELYFDSDLSSGNNTLSVSDADDDALEDAAGFPVADTSENFDVDELSSEPEITSITAEDSGKVYINFDRPMDEKTAKNNKYFKINNEEIDNATIELKKDDTQIKISGVSSLLNKNTIYIDDSVEDAYGNNIPDDTYETFTLDEDTTKPDVSSVYALDEDTIRVKFSKDVDATYATNVSNYTLEDGDGLDITDNIQPINDSSSSYQESNGITIPGKGSSYEVKDGDTTDVVDLHVSENLTDSEYTLTIKNIQDTASTPNIMDDKVIVFDGSEDVSATAEVYKVSADKVVFVFNKAMDGGTLNDTDNYEYVNEKGQTKTLPSSADIDVSDDNKSAVIDLSDTSIVADGSKSSEYNIKSIYATGVKDEDGNSLSTGNNGGTLQDYEGNTTAKKNSLKLYYDDDDLKAKLSFTMPIDSSASDEKTNFELNGETPDSVIVDGSEVTLTFYESDDDTSDSTTKINKIKAVGNGAKLTISNVKDILGGDVTASSVPIYSYDAGPRLITDRDGNDIATNWGENGEATANGNEVDIAVKFDTPISNNSLSTSDFTFSISGATVDASDVSADGTSVVFKFQDDDLQDLKKAVDKSSGDKVKVKVTPKDSSKISTVKDASGDYAYYVPTDDDKDTTYVWLTKEVVNDATSATDTAATNQTDVNNEISKVNPSYTTPVGTVDVAAYLKEQVTTAINDSGTTITVAQNTDGTYKVTLTKGEATASKDNIAVSVATE